MEDTLLQKYSYIAKQQNKWYIQTHQLQPPSTRQRDSGIVYEYNNEKQVMYPPKTTLFKNAHPKEKLHWFSQADQHADNLSLKLTDVKKKQHLATSLESFLQIQKAKLSIQEDILENALKTHMWSTMRDWETQNNSKETSSNITLKNLKRTSTGCFFNRQKETGTWKVGEVDKVVANEYSPAAHTERITRRAPSEQQTKNTKKEIQETEYDEIEFDEDQLILACRDAVLQGMDPTQNQTYRFLEKKLNLPPQILDEYTVYVKDLFSQIRISPKKTNSETQSPHQKTPEKAEKAEKPEKPEKPLKKCNMRNPEPVDGKCPDDKPFLRDGCCYKTRKAQKKNVESKGGTGHTKKSILKKGGKKTPGKNVSWATSVEDNVPRLSGGFEDILHTVL